MSPDTCFITNGQFNMKIELLPETNIMRANAILSQGGKLKVVVKRSDMMDIFLSMQLLHEDKSTYFNTTGSTVIRKLF